MLTGYTGGKILWMKEEEPENYARTKVIINPKDYIRYKLTGVICTEVSDASGYGLFNVERREWAWELIEKIGIERGLFPSCVESTEQTGAVTEEAARECGIPAGTKVYGGGGDAVISTTGMGTRPAGKSRRNVRHIRRGRHGASLLHAQSRWKATVILQQ